jgi:Spy/CpxP family protein refolding chaperone
MTVARAMITLSTMASSILDSNVFIHEYRAPFGFPGSSCFRKLQFFSTLCLHLNRRLSPSIENCTGQFIKARATGKKEKIMKHQSSKLTWVLVAASLLVAGTATARQDRDSRDGPPSHHGGPDAETRVAHMTRQLDLSDEQSAELLLVMQATDAEREVLRQEFRKQAEPELCALQLSTEREISNILTEEQQATLEDMKQERGGRSGNRNSRGAGKMDCSAYE